MGGRTVSKPLTHVASKARGGGGGGLHTKYTLMCVLRIEKYTHFEGHCLRKNLPIMKGLFITCTPILKDNCLGIITKDWSN